MEKPIMVPFFRTAKIRQIMLKRKLDELGLSGLMHTVLHKVGAMGTCTQEQIIPDSLADKGAISRDCARLEELGLITRQPDPENKRRKLLSLTSKGQEIRQELVELDDQTAEMLLRGFTADEKAQFVSYLERMEKNAEGLIQGK
ncbi:MAG: MarR family transcriptional regulator [Firmicutes bacterium]|nr:MarR family transcriptional regulator [Bacillota bacterium]